MIYLLYIVAFLGMIIFHTSVVFFFPVLAQGYDLIALFVIYLGLYRPVRESLPIIVLAGLTMDTISSGPFGLYLTAYGWIFVSVVWMMRFMRAGNHLLLPVIVGVGVLIENLVVIGTVALLTPGMQVPATAARSLALQFLWAVVTGPLLLWVANRLHGRLDRWRAEVFADNGGYG